MVDVACHLYSSFVSQELLLLQAKLEVQESVAMLPGVWSGWMNKADVTLESENTLAGDLLGKRK